MDAIMQERKQTFSHEWEGFLGLSQNMWNAVFCFIVVLGQVAQNVGLPYWGSCSVPLPPTPRGLDAYFILNFAGTAFTVIFGVLTLMDVYIWKTVTWKKIAAFTNVKFILKYLAIGMSDAFNGIFLVFASSRDPATGSFRTPPFLQALLVTTSIFWTIAFRGLLLGHYPNRNQFLYAVGTFVGLFIASVPDIFQLDSSGGTKIITGAWRYIWPFIFTGSLAPAAIMNVVGEDVLQDSSRMDLGRPSTREGGDAYVVLHRGESETDGAQNSLDQALQRGDVRYHPSNRPSTQEDFQVNLWYFLFAESFFQEVTFLAMFWADLIPKFGLAKDVDQIGSNLRWGFTTFGTYSSCTVRAIVFIGGYTISYIGTGLMLRYTEGATWNALIAALVSPLGSLYWIVFDQHSLPYTVRNHWRVTDWYKIVGLVLMAPFIYLYDVETRQIEGSKQKTRADSW